MSAEDILDSRYSWVRLVLTLIVAAVGNVGIWAVVVIMPALQADFAIDRADASIPYTMTMVGFAAGNLLIGRIVDRFGITTALLIATATLCLAYSLTAVSENLFVIYGLHVLVGLGTGSCFGPLLADISHWFSRRRGIAVALVASGNYIAGAFWPMVLSGILAEAGWRGVYSTLAVIVVVSLVPLALLLKRRVPAEAMAHSEALSAVRRRSVDLSLGTLRLLLAVAGVGCCVAMAMPQVHVVSLAVDLGCAPVVGAQILSLMLVGGVVSRIAFGAVADRLGGVKTLLIGATLQCFALSLYLPFDGVVSGLFIVSFVFGLSQGGIVPSYAVIVREYFPAREAGTVIGFVLMATIIGMGVGGWLSGYIRDVTGSYDMAFVNGIAFNVLNMGIMLLILAKTRTPRVRPAIA
ncbi:MFS transporter [Acuticoccus sp. I52.16.1]|uniref:MFS transporter n=1 Tax=Acuticoccus sp. I52.16.1 TaxID=2928472 RepID=UPI001FD1CE1F|nr:MFS transporter [Acuticoccus sp. I52.16.1]UOM34907.1 MFS transporter [Acuticoccus sp. I52.16.1]